MNIANKLLNTDEIIADLDTYARHYHVSGLSRLSIKEETPNVLVEAAKRLYEQGLLSSLEDAQLTREGFEIARQVHQSLTSQAGK